MCKVGKILEQQNLMMTEYQEAMESLTECNQETRMHLIDSLLHKMELTSVALCRIHENMVTILELKANKTK